MKKIVIHNPDGSKHWKWVNDPPLSDDHVVRPPAPPRRAPGSRTFGPRTALGLYRMIAALSDEHFHGKH